MPVTPQALILKDLVLLVTAEPTNEELHLCLSQAFCWPSEGVALFYVDESSRRVIQGPLRPVVASRCLRLLFETLVAGLVPVKHRAAVIAVQTPQGSRRVASAREGSLLGHLVGCSLLKSAGGQGKGGTARAKCPWLVAPQPV